MLDQKSHEEKLRLNSASIHQRTKIPAKLLGVNDLRWVLVLLCTDMEQNVPTAGMPNIHITAAESIPFTFARFWNARKIH